ncbi:MAG TPA: hypothetical protein VI278_16590 [Nitrososphaeraceae archaeon]
MGAEALISTLGEAQRGLKFGDTTQFVLTYVHNDNPDQLEDLLS